jgi:nicotinamide-nucleotide amidase
MENNFYLSQQLATVLQQSGLKLAVAESCTGGGLAYQLTAVPDCSKWFERGFVTYSNAAKIESLGVSAATLEQQGAVSAEVAGEMAKGAVQHSHADIALSITGVAGPSGGTEKKPVGMVYFGLADRHGFCQSRLAHFSSGRRQIRVDSVSFALHWLLEHLSVQAGERA